MFVTKEYIMRNAGLKEAQAEIKIAGRNINNLRYTDDTTLMAESEEELKRLDGLEFEQPPGVGDGQGGLACCDSWGCKESDTIERLN